MTDTWTEEQIESLRNLPVVRKPSGVNGPEAPYYGKDQIPSDWWVFKSWTDYSEKPGGHTMYRWDISDLGAAILRASDEAEERAVARHEEIVNRALALVVSLAWLPMPEEFPTPPGFDCVAPHVSGALSRALDDAGYDRDRLTPELLAETNAAVDKAVAVSLKARANT